jgi:hypothetical protein
MLKKLMKVWIEFNGDTYFGMVPVEIEDGNVWWSEPLIIEQGYKGYQIDTENVAWYDIDISTGRFVIHYLDDTEIEGYAEFYDLEDEE